ncbi:MAG: YeeE/YedE family protein [Bacteroidetes bacterium]|nr:YeeE/YedE family protein [Bacteroidota bacterium]MBS1540629.1 YeeE/YedE family protein [Bacteroidota bacterium]
MELLYKPWPWYLAGTVIGLTIPLLLWMDNKRLGISSTLRHICAACAPGTIPLFQYNWKKEIWSLFFVGGLIGGGLIGGWIFANPEPVAVSASTSAYFSSLGIVQNNQLMPTEFFNWHTLFSLKGFLLMVVGGFLVGFGTRYAQGCTSGHGILGLSALQWPSLLATASFFLGGILFSRFVLPYILLL